jgi:hypothetical protein
MAGYPKDKNSIDNIMGELSQSVNRNFRRASQLKTELDAYTDTQLTNAGYSAGEVTAIRTFATDLLQLSNIYSGSVNLVSVKDFRVSLRPCGACSATSRRPWWLSRSDPPAIPVTTRTPPPSLRRSRRVLPQTM